MDQGNFNVMIESLRVITNAKFYRQAAALLFSLMLCAFGQASTITVDDPSDSGPGDCSTSCTLRDAIANAAPNDTIEFADTLTYPVTIKLAGQELLVYKNLTIIGPGGALLTIDGNQQSRIIEIAANATVTVSGVALNNGTVAGADGGFGSAARAPDGGDAYGGGVLVNAGSSLQLIACGLNGNHATGGYGGTSGAMYSTQGSGGSAHGGAIYSAGTLSVTDASFIGNYVFGGIPGGFLIHSGTSVPGNGGNAIGGAMETIGLTEISNSQFLNNSAQASYGGQGIGATTGGDGGSARGGALAFSAFSAVSYVTALGSSLIPGFGGSGDPIGASGAAAGADVYTTATLLSRANALTSTSGAPTCAAATIVVQGPNLDADNSCQNFTLHGDAKLQIVTSDGDTFALPLWGSPLIDSALDCNDAFGSTLVTDVRGVVRPLDGNADGIAACDVGAVESDELFANGFE